MVLRRRGLDARLQVGVRGPHPTSVDAHAWVVHGTLALDPMAAGYAPFPQIAEQLHLSVKTVEAHKANAMRKLGLRGRIDIVKYAVLQGWLENT